MHIDADALHASLLALRSETESPGLAGYLQRVVGAIEQLFVCDGAGLMIEDPENVLRYVAASGEPGRTLELAQLEAGQGPCIDAFLHNAPVRTPDLPVDERWPAVRDHLHPDVRAVLGVPIRLAGGPVGSLNVYRSEPGPWDDAAVDALCGYAEVVEQVIGVAVTAVEHSTIVEQLQYALKHRVMTERAIGLLMGRHGLDTSTAFELLRRQARDRRERVVTIAAELLGEPRPAEDAKPR
ncbi:GAF and ANTAR domain-containing protein [Actinocorallia longicatena]|uniref:GAF and ANTAR domain-containing protein n=1 Tax=Actinocorallia longicatena TaxID=111803 RepID=A0ABP6Q8K4_9ACTN